MKAIAKERGIKGYYKLRKAVLMNALEATILVKQKSSIFHEPISNDPTHVIQSTPWRSSSVVTKDKQNTKKISLLRVCKRSKILVIGC